VKFVAVAVLLAVASVGQVSADQNAKLQSADLRPYDAANYPKLFAKYGKKFVLNDIQAVRVAAANEMAKETKCNRVLSSDYSDRSTADQIVVFVDCANGYRIWYGGGRILRVAQNPPLE